MKLSPKKLLTIRFFINPFIHKTPNSNSLIPSTINSSLHNPSHSFFTQRCFSSLPQENSNIISSQSFTRIRTIDKGNLNYVSPKLVSQVIDIVRSSNGDYRSKLDSIDTRLSKVSICEIFRVLSLEKVPALQFFEWVRDNHGDVYRNGDVCSLMVDNCGWLNDFETMVEVLKGFRHENICLNDKAFGFLPVLDSGKVRAEESVSLVIRVLNEVGGSVRNSGVHALISMLCVIDCFELAKYVIENTERKLNYYAVLVREKCRRGCADEAYALINEMRVVNCEPDSKIYNYVLGCLCKVDNLSEAHSLLEEMKKAGVDPDEITFEIFISNACRLGRMEFARASFDMLVQTGRVPRLSTCAAIVKGYFNSSKHELAYAFVCDLDVNKMPQVHKMFSLLARLHQKSGNVHAAKKIFDEMMVKGLKPDFGYYSKTVNVLRHVGGKDLAQDLKNKYSEFRVNFELSKNV